MGEMLENMTGWGGRRSMVVLIGMEEYHYVIDGLISSYHKICVRYRNFDKILGSSVLDILPNFLQLEVHCIGCI